MQGDSRQGGHHPVLRGTLGVGLKCVFIPQESATHIDPVDNLFLQEAGIGIGLGAWVVLGLGLVLLLRLVLESEIELELGLELESGLGLEPGLGGEPVSP